MTRMLAPESRYGLRIRIAAIVALGAAGIVLATSWMARYPGWVLALAALGALIAAVTVVIDAWISARRSGLGIFAAIGKGLRALGRFIRDFF